MNRKGFTLLEVLVGTVVLSMMVFLIWSITSTNLNAIDRIKKRDDLFQMGRIAISRITRDINMAFLVTNKELLGNNRDGSAIETIFIGNDKGEYDSLKFSALSNWRMFRDVKESDQAEIWYYVEPMPADSRKFRLMRRLGPYLDGEYESGGSSYPVAEGISAFELSYYDMKAGDWTDNWNSNEVDHKNQLPRGVRIKLSFPSPDEDVEESLDFSTIAFIGLWQNPINF